LLTESVSVCFSCIFWPRDSAYTAAMFLVWCRISLVLVSTVRHIITLLTSVLFTPVLRLTVVISFHRSIILCLWHARKLWVNCKVF